MLGKLGHKSATCRKWKPCNCCKNAHMRSSLLFLNIVVWKEIRSFEYNILHLCMIKHCHSLVFCYYYPVSSWACFPASRVTGNCSADIMWVWDFYTTCLCCSVKLSLVSQLYMSVCVSGFPVLFCRSWVVFTLTCQLYLSRVCFNFHQTQLQVSFGVSVIRPTNGSRRQEATRQAGELGAELQGLTGSWVSQGKQQPLCSATTGLKWRLKCGGSSYSEFRQAEIWPKHPAGFTPSLLMRRHHIKIGWI